VARCDHVDEVVARLMRLFIALTSSSCRSVLSCRSAVEFPYPRDILGAEAATLSFLAVIDAGRMALGHKGNLTQSRLPLLLFVLLCCPVLLGHIFFLEFQTYVMRLDQIINVIALVRRAT
jgi:hypothetical protein